MAKLNPTQQAIADAFVQYKEGSSAVIRSFEKAILDFWMVDRCRCDNLTFFVNTAKRFPVLQKTVINVLKFGEKDPTGEKGLALGYFDIKKDKETGLYTVTNKVAAKEGEIAITKEMKSAARKNVRAFIANEYTSLLNVKGIKVEVAFDITKSGASIKASITSNLKKMLAENADADPAILQKIAMDAVAEAFKAENILKVKADLAKAA